jgi:hypothetical protein
MSIQRIETVPHYPGHGYMYEDGDGFREALRELGVMRGEPEEKVELFIDMLMKRLRYDTTYTLSNAGQTPTLPFRGLSIKAESWYHWVRGTRYRLTVSDLQDDAATANGKQVPENYTERLLLMRQGVYRQLDRIDVYLHYRPQTDTELHVTPVLHAVLSTEGITPDTLTETDDVTGRRQLVLRHSNGTTITLCDFGVVSDPPERASDNPIVRLQLEPGQDTPPEALTALAEDLTRALQPAS